MGSTRVALKKSIIARGFLKVAVGIAAVWMALPSSTLERKRVNEYGLQVRLGGTNVQGAGHDRNGFRRSVRKQTTREVNVQKTQARPQGKSER
jgi:hypothetical protein